MRPEMNLNFVDQCDCSKRAFTWDMRPSPSGPAPYIRVILARNFRFLFLGEGLLQKARSVVNPQHCDNTFYAIERQ